MNTHDSRTIRTLLVPLDGSEFSRRILDQVRALFAPDRFRIALLHVADPPAGFNPPYHPAAVGPDYTLYAYEMRGRGFDARERDTYERHALYEGEAYDAYRERLERELERELTLFRSEGYEASATVHFGDPVEEIVAFAQDEAIAAIAMATHGRTGLGRLMQGSVAQAVFARLDRPVPVLLLRPGEAQDEAATAERAADHGTRSDMRSDAVGTYGVGSREVASREVASRDVGSESAGGDATLADLPGTGRLAVRRRADGALEEATGTFTLADPTANLMPLHEAQRENLQVTYDGPIYDPDGGREQRRRTQVFITRIRENPAYEDPDERTEPVRIEFAAGEIVDGDLVTQRSRARNRDEAAAF